MTTKHIIAENDALILIDEMWSNGIVSIAISQEDGFLYATVKQEQAKEIIKHLQEQFKI